MKGEILSIMTNIGSPVGFISLIDSRLLVLRSSFSLSEINVPDALLLYRLRTTVSKPTPLGTNLLLPRSMSILPSRLRRLISRPWLTLTISILTCTQYVVGSNGTVQVNYVKGGHPVILVPDDIVEAAGMCDSLLASTKVGSKSSGGSAASSASHILPWMQSGLLALVGVVASMLL